MATISTMMKLQDRFTTIIEKSINAMGRMVDGMEEINRAEGNLDMGPTFAEIRQSISLADHALDQFNKELKESKNHEQSVNRLTGGFGRLSKAIVVANQGLELIQKAWGALDRLGSSSDARVGADARLAIINDGLRTQEQLEAQVMSVANKTRSEYEATAELVARMGRQDYFKGNNDMALAFAETLNKGLIVSGASAQEANSALIQLSQGIASGVLRGEEFNSIMENGSVLAEMMATSLGVTKGQLRAMAQDGQLTTDVVVSSIMAQAAAIDEQFASMPTTYGQAQNRMHNITSRIMANLAEPGGGIDLLVDKLGELTAWLDTADGSRFLAGMGSAITMIVGGLLTLGQLAGSTYLFFADNWPAIEPIVIGLAVAVGTLTTAWLVYKGVQVASAAATGITAAATLVQALAAGTATAAQWGLNASLLACPLTWIVVAIMAVITAVVAFVVWIYKLWQTNIDFRVGVIQIWNSVLGFFEHVPLFFMGIGNGIANAFSVAKSLVLLTLEEMVNGAIERINKLISFANKIPGVSIDVIDNVTFGTEAAIEEQAKREARNADLQREYDNLAARSAAREQKLQSDADRWRAEAAATEAANKDNAAQNAAEKDFDFSNVAFPKMELAGGTKVGIEEESLEYLNDIAEMRVLQSFEGGAGLHLTPEDAALMRSSATPQNNIFYVNHDGSVKTNVDYRQGEDWDTIRRQMEEDSQNQINTGLDSLEEVVFGG